MTRAAPAVEASRRAGARHLTRLTNGVPLAGPLARGIAVYAEPSSPEKRIPDVQRPAMEQGYEGVACIDDAARAVVLHSRKWEYSQDAAAKREANQLLQFVAYMQNRDGRFSNFILDWTGEKNLTGPTSYAGGAPWQARALHALAYGVAVFGEELWGERFDKGVQWLDLPMPYMDVRAVCLLAALKHWQATGSRESRERSLMWAYEIAGAQDGDHRLLDATGVPEIHLWGHLQERALVEAGVLLRRPELVEIARKSADALLLPAAEGLSAAPNAFPFEVSCLMEGLTAVGLATEDSRYVSAAALAKSWFAGNNSAGTPVYDARLGLFYDGIDDGLISRNSGAESNIEGGLALLSQ